MKVLLEMKTCIKEIIYIFKIIIKQKGKIDKFLKFVWIIIGLVGITIKKEDLTFSKSSFKI